MNVAENDIYGMERKREVDLATTEITKYLEDAIEIYGKYENYFNFFSIFFFQFFFDFFDFSVSLKEN